MFQVYFDSELHGVINLKGLLVSKFQIKFQNFTYSHDCIGSCKSNITEWGGLFAFDEHAGIWHHYLPMW